MIYFVIFTSLTAMPLIVAIKVAPLFTSFFFSLQTQSTKTKENWIPEPPYDKIHLGTTNATLSQYAVHYDYLTDSECHLSAYYVVYNDDIL